MGAGLRAGLFEAVYSRRAQARPQAIRATKRKATTGPLGGSACRGHCLARVGFHSKWHLGGMRRSYALWCDLANPMLHKEQFVWFCGHFWPLALRTPKIYNAHKLPPPTVFHFTPAS